MRSEITADQNLRLAQKMLKQQGELNSQRERIAAVLADCDRVEREGTVYRDSTHDPDCWQAHAGCLAAAP